MLQQGSSTARLERLRQEKLGNCRYHASYYKYSTAICLRWQQPLGGTGTGRGCHPDAVPCMRGGTTRLLEGQALHAVLFA